MTPTSHSPTGPARAFTSHMAHDLLGFTQGGHIDYKRIADIAHLSKDDLGKLAKVKRSSVRWDHKIPESVATRLREIANIANHVAEFFNGDASKVALWFELPNPMLGDLSPRNLIRAGRYNNLLNFVLDAREAELATPHSNATYDEAEVAFHQPRATDATA